MKDLVSLPIDQWPSADSLVWGKVLDAGDDLDGRGPLHHLRMTSRRALEKIYGRWLQWLTAHIPHCLADPPTCRATVERLLQWLDELRHATAVYRANVVRGVCNILKAAAPQQDWTLHDRFLKQLSRKANTAPSARKIGRILPSDRIFEAGKLLAERIADGGSSRLNTALMQRNGTIIAFLAVLPIRLGSLCSLQLGSSVYVSDNSIEIVLTPEMTKTGRHWRSSVPSSLLKILQTYIFETRPFLVSRGSEAHCHLWVNYTGGPLRYGTIANMVPRITGQILKVKVSPHLIRDAAATTLFSKAPGETHLITSLLGHSSIETAQRHYNHNTGNAARCSYTALIESFRKED